MFVTPKENPIFASLNSYYVNIERLIEHFQGEVGCGALSFKSSSSEGILFFDKDEILNGIYFQKNNELTGSEAVDQLIQLSESTNFSLNVYLLRAEDIYFWSTMPNAQRIYQDLTTEFTDLEGLIKKMKSEGLTGFIEVVIGDANGEGLIFFNNGQVSGGSYSWGSGDSRREEEDQEKLVQLTKDHGGAFHVSRIPMDEKNIASETDDDLNPEEVLEKPSTRIVTAMEEMMAIFERTVSAQKNIPSDFATLLNRKFVEKADRYPFLDPFAAEFKYAEEKIKFDGDTTDKELTQGVLESIKELAAELDALTQFKSNLVTWMKKYSEEVKLFDIKL
ncbi:MAG: hypothetical protein HF981_09905 [Desulfobacteraceae bacterium]|nr:hypothetical protein [Desulfobacteraceae bacterium]MBC2750688.1 hypothetical protein [Desulfobacteraceae bacterium]